MWIVLTIVVVLVVLVGLFVVTALNRLRGQQVSVEEAEAGIDVSARRARQVLLQAFALL